MMNRDEYVRKMKEQLDQWNAEVAKWQAKAQAAKADKPLAERSTAVEFAPLTGDRLPKWVAHHAETVLGRPITTDAASLLVEAVGAAARQRLVASPYRARTII